MRIKPWLEDTIARRFALTIVLTIVVALGLTGMAIQFAGVWGRPPLREMGLLERANDIVRMVEAVPTPARQVLTDAATNSTFRVQWYSAVSTVTAMLDAGLNLRTPKDLPGFESGGHRRRVMNFASAGPDQLVGSLRLDRADYPDAYFLAVGLDDGSWVVFVAPTRVWGLHSSTRIGIGLALLVVSIIAVSAVATYQLSRPIREFTEALRRFGTDPRAASIPEAGPHELRASIGAFNAMQAQVQTFVDDRTAMLAAISHDLRTPLTKMRLRGEFIEDERQRAHLFRDVDEMQAMVNAALSFFRDDLQAEGTTSFDIPQLLLTIVDDYSDRGVAVGYRGPDHAVFRGRPFALKRSFQNLIDNAIRYGECCEVELRCGVNNASVLIRDRGPGIPVDSIERVFAPFYRLERSRHRGTGGVGLGLTSARAIIIGHGGHIRLSDRRNGGLEVEVTLPYAT